VLLLNDIFSGIVAGGGGAFAHPKFLAARKFTCLKFFHKNSKYRVEKPFLEI